MLLPIWVVFLWDKTSFKVAVTDEFDLYYPPPHDDLKLLDCCETLIFIIEVV